MSDVMERFRYSFVVDAPVQAVSDFHHDTRVLKKLTPPPLLVQIHQFEPLAEGAEAMFTLWFGPIAVRWHAVHVDVVPPRGFTDIQRSGPLKSWRHTHRFTAVSPHQTRVTEQIDYAYHDGWRGWLSRLFFSPPALTLLFSYRRLATRWHLRRAALAHA